MNLDSVGTGIKTENTKTAAYILLWIALVVVVFAIIRRLIWSNVDRDVSIIEKFNNYTILNSNNIPANIAYNASSYGIADPNFSAIINKYGNDVINAQLTKLDDATRLSKINLDAIRTIKKQLTSDSMISEYPGEKPISAIRSIYNSQILTVNNIDGKYYKIQINDKCLTVYGDNDYTLSTCQDNTPSQGFYHERITNDNDAKRVFGNIPGSDNAAVYPYSVFKSVVTDQCLTSGDKGITVENANVNDARQKWQISPDAYVCDSFS